MAGFSVKLNSAKVRERLALATALFKRPDVVYREIKRVLTERVMRRFETKTDPEGVTWDDWKPRTLAKRLKLGGVAYKAGPVSLLQLSDTMRKSFFARTEGGVVKVGFGVDYAGRFETGTAYMDPRRILTDGKGGMARSDRIAVGLAARRAILTALNRK